MNRKSHLKLLFILAPILSSSLLFAQTEPCTNSGNCTNATVPSISNNQVFEYCEDDITIAGGGGGGVDRSKFTIPQISSGVPSGNSWYKKDGNFWTPLGNNSNLSLNQNDSTGYGGRYKLCIDQFAGGCKQAIDFTVKRKSLKDQLQTEGELNVIAGIENKCSESSIQLFNSKNEAKYSYEWTNPNLFKNDIVDINNKFAKYMGSPSLLIKDQSQKRTTSRTFSGEALIKITEKSTGCNYIHQVKNEMLYPMYPEIYNPNEICQNANGTIDVRVVVDGKPLSALTPFGGTNSASISVNGVTNTYTAKNIIASNQLPNNTLGNNNALLNSPAVYAQVFTFPFSSSTSGNVVVDFSLETTLGCRVSESFSVNVKPSTPFQIEVGLGNQTDFCEDIEETGPLKALNAPTGIFSSTTPNTVKLRDGQYYFYPKLAEAGAHNIIFTVNNTNGGTNCSGGGNQIVNVIPLPKPDLVGREAVCPGSSNIVYKDLYTMNGSATRTFTLEDNLQTDISNNGSVTITLSGADTRTLSFSNPFTPAPPQGIVNLIVKIDDRGCSASDVLKIKVSSINTAPAPDGPDAGCTSATTPFSFNTSFALDNGFTRTWRVNNQNPPLAPNNPNGGWDIPANSTAGTYSLQFEDTETANPTCKISSLAKNFLLVAPPNPVISGNSSYCPGEPINLSVNAETDITYTWLPEDKVGTTVSYTTPTYNPINTNANIIPITVKASTPNNVCPEIQATTQVAVKPAPKNPLPESKIDHCFDDVPIYSLSVVREGFNTVLWEDTDPLLSGNATLDITSEGIYKVSVTDNISQCTVKDFVIVENICGAKFFLPAAFSPNNDKVNDSLKVFGNHFESFDLKIFSRWGEVVFSTKDHKEQWDGNFGGQPLPPGTYPYVVVYESLNEKNKKITTTKEGSVTLIR
jgi:gliding motility-associated-like protein